MVHTFADCIYYITSETSSGSVDINWFGDEENKVSFFESNSELMSKKAGLLHSGTEFIMNDYSYTDSAMIMSGSLLETGDSLSVILDYKKKSKKVLPDTDLQKISVTKLPDEEVTP